MSAPALFQDHEIRRVLREGPLPSDYALCSSLVRELVRHCTVEPSGSLAADDRERLHALFSGQFQGTQTLLGHCLTKPHGYAGDYEIIDSIYTRRVSSDGLCGRWDRLFHSLAGPRAVRNRKEYFKGLLRMKLRESDAPLTILNVASGPARDVREVFEEVPGAAERVTFDCVDMDEDAIRYAKGLTAPYGDRVRFSCDNVLRFRPERPYDLVWSAGLFDYFDDRIFARVLRRLHGAVAPGGELVVGNFHPSDPTRAWMLLQDWILQYRDESHLHRLALEAGVSAPARIEMEPEGVNLFLRLRTAP